MRVVFAGTPEFARQALQALIAAGHEIPLVLTQPDRPAGRGLKLTPSAVKQAAMAANIPVIQPRGLKLDGRYAEDAQAARQSLLDAKPDVMVVAAYGLILPRWVLDLPAHGCLNIHASLLPRWRGAAPIQRAIEAGDPETGITIMQMDEGLDTGDMLLRLGTPITSEHTAATLHDELAQMGAKASVQALELLQSGALTREKQPEDRVTYASKLEKSEAPLDFLLPASQLARRVRAFNPFPGATMMLPGLDAPVKVWQAVALPKAASSPAGTIESATAEGIDIATGDGILRVTELQKAGGKRQAVSTFVQGWQPE
ncbi:MAG TPA: methionyl-tRNA formyltransferase [Pusillimonas sp.]|uniref:methionyl-tRNA formyltransferase n=1 Tax=unclassified Pusillimonas TaxID=2640016 RepID=UPI0026311187|nr:MULTISPECIES: methionyl-tRNA formyltransferase [unclassified Pusillimonas]HLU18875.1 methionyl-tRNA formyltransferase [Pusillimonas sp.]